MTQPSKSNEIKDEIYTIFHNFHRECLKEPYEGQPILRRARKNNYTDKIYSLFNAERKKAYRDGYKQGRFDTEMDRLNNHNQQ